MKYYRVTYDPYIEDEYETEVEARQAFLDFMLNATAWDLSVEIFNEETKKWE